MLPKTWWCESNLYGWVHYESGYEWVHYESGYGWVHYESGYGWVHYEWASIRVLYDSRTYLIKKWMNEWYFRTWLCLVKLCSLMWLMFFVGVSDHGCLWQRYTALPPSVPEYSLTEMVGSTTEPEYWILCHLTLQKIWISSFLRIMVSLKTLVIQVCQMSQFTKEMLILFVFNKYTAMRGGN